MIELITINGERFEGKEFFRTLMYGEGVFETFRYRDKMPERIDKHYQRLLKGAKLLKIPPISKEDFLYCIEKTVSQSESTDLYVKAILVAEGNLSFPLLPYSSNLIVIVRPFKERKKEKISLIVAPFRIHSSNPLLKIKTTNFAEKLLANRYAKEKGYDDAVFLNEKNEITETTTANIFWVKGKFMYTPSIDCGLLPGITREAVIQEAKKEGFTVVEGRFYLEDIKNADLIFITNSLNGIIRVGKFDFLNKEES